MNKITTYFLIFVGKLSKKVYGTIIYNPGFSGFGEGKDGILKIIVFSNQLN